MRCPADDAATTERPSSAAAVPATYQALQQHDREEGREQRVKRRTPKWEALGSSVRTGLPIATVLRTWRVKYSVK